MLSILIVLITILLPLLTFTPVAHAQTATSTPAVASYAACVRQALGERLGTRFALGMATSTMGARFQCIRDANQNHVRDVEADVTRPLSDLAARIRGHNTQYGDRLRACARDHRDGSGLLGGRIGPSGRATSTPGTTGPGMREFAELGDEIEEIKRCHEQWLGSLSHATATRERDAAERRFSGGAAQCYRNAADISDETSRENALKACLAERTSAFDREVPPRSATSTPASTDSNTEALHQQLQALLTQIALLQHQLRAASAGAPPTGSLLPAHSFCALPARVLQRGDRGTDVMDLQRLLVERALLAADAITGFFGQLTVAAVQRYQAAQTIVTSGDPTTTGYGVVGPRTRASLCR